MPMPLAHFDYAASVASTKNCRLRLRLKDSGLDWFYPIEPELFCSGDILQLSAKNPARSAFLVMVVADLVRLRIEPAADIDKFLFFREKINQLFRRHAFCATSVETRIRTKTSLNGLL